MALPRRNLKFRFPRSIVTESGRPETLIVAIVPLATPSAPGQGTYVGGVQEAEAVLSQQLNELTFEILPSDHPTLTERVIYRVGWRSKFLGAETHYEIVMPDQDIYFDELDDLGAVIGGEVYLKQGDRLRPGGVAGLNDNGEVIDAQGNVVSGDGSAQQVSNRLDNEIINRQQADNALANTFSSQLTTQYQSVLQTTATNLAVAVSNLESADLTEAAVRANAVTTLNNSLQALQTSTNNAIAILNNNLATYAGQFAAKADLVGGKLKVDQVPDIAIGKAVSVANEAAMLALNSTQVQPGDLAVRPDGVWFLNATNPASIGNWVQTTHVVSVNNKKGAVTLTASDVGARSASVLVPSDQVDGLATALDGKASTTSVTNLGNRVTTIENDPKIVRLNNSDQIPSALLDSGVVYVDSANQIRKKDGTVLAVNGGGLITSVNGKQGVVVLNAGDVGARPVGVPLVVNDITNLQSLLNGKIDSNDPRLTDARTPTPHAASHRPGGTDALNLGVNDITGLATQLSGKASVTTVTTQGNRISSLETRVTDIETNGSGGGGGGSSAKTVWYDGLAYTTDITDVLIKSPFGFDGTNYYYDPAGAANGEWRYPYISKNGHFSLREWNEAAPPDPELALQSDLELVIDELDTKATVTQLNTKANQADLDTTNSQVLLKANQSTVDTLTTTVNGKAAQSSVDALAIVVSTKANQSDLDTLTGVVNGHTTTLGTKADLSGGVLASAQIPNVPQNKVVNLPTTLAAKADLDGGGKLLLTQVPNGISQTAIAGLATTFAGKADLDSNGKVLTSQLPALSTSETFVVANRAAMLALTTSQVQRGDIAVISQNPDKGSYILSTNDPSQFANWVLLSAADASVTSVNGQTGVVVLGASDVGARSSAVPVPEADVQNLTSRLAAKADASQVSADLATKTSTTDVRSILSSANQGKQVVGYVATAPISNLSGQQVADGILMPVGSLVLLTAQVSSIQNGIYTVSSGAWSRAADMATGNYFVRGSLVVVSNGSSNAATLWQETATSGVVDVNNNNWSKIGSVANPYAPQAGNGITITGTTFAVKPTTGITVTSAGVGIDATRIPSKFSMDVPSTGTTVTIPHNLGTTDVVVQVREKASGDVVDLAPTITGINAVSLEFGSVPASGQYRVVVIG